MKTLGLIGGMSWESTALYYGHLNEAVRERLGGLHSASLLIDSVDFAGIAALQHAGDWGELGRLMAASARRLAGAGAEAIVLCTNSMHKVAASIEQAVDVPLLHIVDATADALIGAGSTRPILLGTAFTMESEFYRDRLAARGVDVVVPDAAGRELTHRVIYDELTRGVVNPESRARLVRMTSELLDRGADGLILGCTELPMILGEDDVRAPIFDTTEIHADAAVRFALAGAVATST